MIEVFFTDKYYDHRSVYSPARGVTKDRIIREAKKLFGRDIDIHTVVGYHRDKYRAEYIKDNCPHVKSTLFLLDPILEPEPFVENHG